MKNMKFWRTTLVAALVLTVMLSVTSGTIAWFTDTVTSDSNIIASGTLTAAMEWADGKDAPDTANWKDASEGAIFNYDKWEPGYTEVRHIRIQNTGNLAFKYQLNIVPTGEVSDLADVIDVYYFDPAEQIVGRSDLAAETALGTLTDALAGMPASTSGVLLPADTADEDNPDNLPKGEVMVTVALKMQESAGNEYQGKSIGSQFAVQLLATQLAFEEDSFDETYDGESKMAMEISSSENTVANEGRFLNGTDGMVLVGDGKETTTLVSNYTGKEPTQHTITANNLTLANLTVQAESGQTAFVIEGDGTTVNDVAVDLVAHYEGIPYNSSYWGFTVAGSNATFSNVEFSGGTDAALYFSKADTADSVTIIDNCKFNTVTYSDGTVQSGAGIRFTGLNGAIRITGTTFDCGGGRALYIGASSGAKRGSVSIIDSVINSKWARVANVKTAILKNVTIGNEWDDNPLEFTVSATEPVVFENCHFTSNIKFLYPTALSFVNCTFGEEKTSLTSDNFNSCGLFTRQYGSNSVTINGTSVQFSN